MNKNVEKVFNLKLTEDMVRELQVLGAEVDARAYVIDSMFENHKTDTDNSVFTSVPFQAYQKELIEYRRAYDKEVERLGEKLIPSRAVITATKALCLRFGLKKLSCILDKRRFLRKKDCFT